MGTLDIPIMAKLKDRVGAPGGQGDDLVKLMPPAKLITGLRHPL